LQLGWQTEFEKASTRKDIAHFEKAVAGFRGHNEINLLRALYQLSYAYGYHREYDAARKHLTEYLHLAHDLKEGGRLVMGLRHGACLAARQYRHPDAIRLFGAAERIAEEVDYAPTPSEYQAKVIRSLRRYLVGFRFRSRWTAGRALSVVDAIALATKESPPRRPWFRWPRTRMHTAT
jgi:hypothetical protein